MTIDSFDTVFYTLVFLVPGFLFCQALSLLLPGADRKPDKPVLLYLSTSAFNYAFWSWLIYLIAKHGLFAQHPLRAAAAWFLIIFLSPLLFACAVARLADSGTVHKWLEKAGIYAPHHIPTAWDWVFSNLRKGTPQWVIVVLKDGSTIGGLYGAASFASSAADERDLYISHAYRIDSNGNWQPTPNTAGMLINADQIGRIEFMHNKGDK